MDPALEPTVNGTLGLSQRNGLCDALVRWTAKQRAPRDPFCPASMTYFGARLLGREIRPMIRGDASERRRSMQGRHILVTRFHQTIADSTPLSSRGDVAPINNQSLPL